MRSLFLNILLGMSVICGNCHAGNDSQDRGDSQRSRRPWLHQWKSIGDVNKCAEFLNKYGHDCRSVDAKVIQKTLEGFGIQQNGEWNWPNDPNSNEEIWKALCVFTCAFYSVANCVPFWSDIISSVVKAIIECMPFTFNDQLFEGPTTRQDYVIRLGWLLYLSQTEGKEGKKLVQRYEIYTISIAKELLEEPKGTMQKIAEKMLKKINDAQNVSSAVDELHANDDIPSEEE